MLRTRLFTAIILIPAVAWFIYLGNLPFLGLIGLLATIAEIELSGLISRRGFRPVHLFGIALVWLFLLHGEFGQADLVIWGLAGVLLASLSWQVLRYPHSTVQDWTGAIASGAYLGLCSAFLVRLRALPGDGLWWTLTAVPVTLLADSTAYVVGSLWGKRRLARRLSPGKTLEGHVGGVLAGGMMGALLGWAWGLTAGPGTSVTWTHGLALGLLIAAFAPMGDLAISTVKREAGVKDSGKLLPGHGGILDRMDSVLFAAVISYAYVLLCVD